MVLDVFFLGECAMLYAASLPHLPKLKTSSSELSRWNWHYALHSRTCLYFWLHAPYLSRNHFSCMITGVTIKRQNQCPSKARKKFSKLNLNFALVSCIGRRKLCWMSKACVICSQYKIRLYKYTLCDVNCARSFFMARFEHCHLQHFSLKAVKFMLLFYIKNQHLMIQSVRFSFVWVFMYCVCCAAPTSMVKQCRVEFNDEPWPMWSKNHTDRRIHRHHNVTKKLEETKQKNVPIFNLLNILVEMLRYLTQLDSMSFHILFRNKNFNIIHTFYFFFCFTTYVSNSLEIPPNMANIGRKHLNSVLLFSNFLCIFFCMSFLVLCLNFCKIFICKASIRASKCVICLAVCAP